MASTKHARHLATRQEVLAAAWELSRRQGLTGWSLRDLGAAVGMRAPSLYVYFAGKDAIYDAMFADGYAQLLTATRTWAAQQDLTPRDRLRDAAHQFFAFAVAEPARMLLMFHRTVPGFTPSPESYAAAQEVLSNLEQVLAEAGITTPGAVDLWTALLSGLTSQQVSNDPGGQRWARLVDEAVDMFLAHHDPAWRATRPADSSIAD